MRRESCFLCETRIEIGTELVRRKVTVDIKEKRSHPDSFVQRSKYYPYRLQVAVCMSCASEEEKADE